MDLEVVYKPKNIKQDPQATRDETKERKGLPTLSKVSCLRGFAFFDLHPRAATLEREEKQKGKKKDDLHPAPILFQSRLRLLSDRR